MSFGHILSLPPTTTLHIPLLPIFMFSPSSYLSLFLLQKKEKENQNKQAREKKKTKKIAIRTQSTQTSRVHFVLASYSMEPTLKCGWCTQWHSIFENWCSLSQHVSIANGFLIISGTLCLLTLLSVRILSVLHLYRSWTHCYNLFEFICVSVLTVSEDMISLESFTTSGSLQSFCFHFSTDLWAFQGGVWQRHLGLSDSKPFTLSLLSSSGSLC